MKSSRIAFAITATIAILLPAGPQAFAASPTSSITNDAVWNDAGGKEIKAQGGSVLKVGSTYYWVGTELNNASYFYTAINMYKSTDLENWSFVKSVFTAGGGNPVSAGASASDLGTNRWLGRPDLVRRPNGSFLIVMEIDSQSNGAQGNWVGFASSPTIEGTYTYNGRKALPGNAKSGDHSLFVDGANAYYVYIGDTATPSYVRNTTMNIQKLNAAWTGFDTGPSGTVLTQTDTTHEAPFVLKVGSRFHMFASNKDWWGPTRTDHRSGASLGAYGAWSPLATSPGTPDSFNTQFDFIIPVTGSGGTSYLYGGDRYSNFRGATDGTNPVAFSQGLGRNAWYPLTFAAGSPTLHGWSSTDVNISTAALTGNRITNGSFDMYDPTPAPGFWTEEPGSGFSPSASATDAGGVVDGATGLPTSKLTITAPSPVQSYVSQQVSGLTAGRTYTVTADVASSGGQTYATMLLKQSGQPDVVTTIGGAQNRFSTRSATVTVAASAGGIITVGFYVSSPANTWLAVDNVSVR